MMKKIVLLICLCLVLAGCKGGFRIGGFKTEPTITETEVYVGSEGLNIDFVENQPPKEILEGEVFVVGIDLRNVGTYSIDKGWVRLLSIGRGEMEIEGELKKPIQIEGKEFGNIEGGRTFVYYTVTNKELPRDRKSLFKAEACYEYKTTASVPICINPQTGATVAFGAGGCQVKDVRSSGQGAPIVVSKVRPIVTRRSSNEVVMRLEIEIDNKGKGEIVEYGADDVCAGQPKIKVDSVTVSGRELVSECSGLKDGHLELGKDEENNKFTCELPLDPAQGAYITPLIIELSYAYSQMEEIEVSVRER